VPNEVLAISFWKLLHGEAVYGKPGVGCDGPYEVRRLLIEVQPKEGPKALYQGNRLGRFAQGKAQGEAMKHRFPGGAGKRRKHS
jgi:hypothetical protein